MRDERNKIIGWPNNLGANLDDNFTMDNNLGYSTIGFYCELPCSGSICFEATFDGINWTGINLRSIENDIYMQTTNCSGNFIGSIIGTKAIRVRTCTAGTAPGTVRGVMDQAVSVLEGIEFGYPPHRFGFEQIHKDLSLTNATTGAILWAPATGKRFIITDFIIIGYGTTDATTSIFEDTDVPGNRLFRGTIEVVTNKGFRIAHGFKTPFRASDINKILKVSTSHNLNIDISVHGYEV
jgi:hypothetical protein